MIGKRKQNSGAKKAEDSWPKRHFYVVFVFCFSFLLYCNTIPNGYNLDDELVTRNHVLTSQGISAIPKIFTSTYYSNSLGYAYGYRPLVHVSFAIEHQLFGDNPHISHFFNTILYALLCVLIFTALQLLLAGLEIPLLPFVAALLFAAHPVHTEVVASIKNRDEILAFIFITMAWIVMLRKDGRYLPVKIFLSASLFFLGLLAKPTLFSFALIIPLSGLMLRRLGFLTALMLAFMYSVIVVLLMGEYKLNDKLLVLSSGPAAIIGVGSLWYWNAIINILKIIAGKLKNFIYFLTALFIRSYRHVFTTAYRYRTVYYFLLVLAPVIITIAWPKFMWDYRIMAYVTLVGSALLFVWYKEEIEQLLAFIIFEGTLFFIQTSFGVETGFIAHANFLFITIFFAYCSRFTKAALGLIFLIQYILGFHINGALDLFPVVTIIIYLLAGGKWKQKKYDLLFFTAIALIATGVSIYRIFLNHTYDYEPLFILPFWLWTIVQIRRNAGISKVKPSVWYIVILTILFTLITDKNAIRQNRILLKYLAGLPKGATTPGIRYLAALDDDLSPDKAVVLKKSKEANKIFNLPAINPRTINRPLDYVEVPVSNSASIPVRLASAFDVLFRYLKLCIIPYPLSFYYGYKVIGPVNFLDARVIAGVITYAFLLLLLVYVIYKHHGAMAMAIAIYLIGIIPFTNTFQAIPGMLAERYLLAPTLGFCMLAVILVAKLANMKPAKNIDLPALNPKVKYLFLLWLMAYSVITFSRNLNWKDDLTLFRHDLKHVDESAQAHDLLAVHLAIAAQQIGDVTEQKKLRDEAVVQFKKSLGIRPQYFHANYDLARTWLDLNAPDSAMLYFRKALSINDTFPDVYLYIGSLLTAQNKYFEAIPLLQYVVQRRPNDYDGYNKLSLLYFKIGQYDSSLTVNRKAIRLMPDNYLPYFNIGRTYLGMGGMTDSALFYLKQAYSLNANDPQLQAALGQLGIKSIP